MFSGSHHSAGFLEIINYFIHVLATVPSIYSEIKVFFLFLFFSRWHVATGVQVGSNLDIYNYMVVYIVVIEVMKNLLKFLSQKIYIIEIIYHRLNTR